MASKVMPDENAGTDKFIKENIVATPKYRSRADLLNVLLKDGESYSLDEVDAEIKKFMERKVT